MEERAPCRLWHGIESPHVRHTSLPVAGVQIPAAACMEPSEVSHPGVVTATCVNCEETHGFTPEDANVTDKEVHFGCPECDHTITLALNP